MNLFLLWKHWLCIVYLCTDQIFVIILFWKHLFCILYLCTDLQTKIEVFRYQFWNGIPVELQIFSLYIFQHFWINNAYYFSQLKLLLFIHVANINFRLLAFPYVVCLDNKNCFWKRLIRNKDEWSKCAHYQNWALINWT